ncbi:unnamed protein product [Brassica rapa]|nr:unnamed protein product [Brassica napus]CAG7876369.1 unnamed protein product [Brassica rapa]
MKKTISEIIEARLSGTCVVVAKIEAIDLKKPWYYTACNFCKRKMVRQVDGFEGNVQHLQQNPLYNYKTCKKDVQHAIHCYYLVVRISDESKGEAKFLLFNNIGEKLIRRLASELVQEAAQRTEYLSGYGNPKERKKVEVHYARENGRV